MNQDWHQRHVLPKNANLGERMAWHREHQRLCACRPIPPKLKAQMSPPRSTPATATKRNKAATKTEARASHQVGEADPTLPTLPTLPMFAPVVAAFAKDRRVTFGGKGFGSSGLKVDGKLFALISSRGKFVAKLPRQRVDELVRQGGAEHFDPGHGRLMKEWVALDGAKHTWIDLATEAHRFVGGGTS